MRDVHDRNSFITQHRCVHDTEHTLCIQAGGGQKCGMSMTETASSHSIIVYMILNVHCSYRAAVAQKTEVNAA